jgi:hypothetical protein
MSMPEYKGAVPGPLREDQELSLSKEEFAEQEFVDKAVLAAREYGTKSIETFYRGIRKGDYKEVLGTVPESGTETEIALESNNEHMFVNICDAHKLPLFIIGEHHSYKTPLSNGINPGYISFIDSLDDTRELEQGGLGNRGLPAPLWTNASFYNLEGKPLVGMIANLKEKYMYFSVNGKNYHIDLETGEEKEIKPSSRTSIKDKDFCLATYVGDPKYFVSFAENFLEVEKVLRDTDNNAVNQPHTGSFIYGPMAEGTVDAYLIAREPARERLPGWIFAETAGFTAWEIDPKTGDYKKVEDDLKLFKDNPNEYRKKRTPIYLVTRFDQVRDEIISLIKIQHQKNELQKIKDAFIETRSKEFEIFRAEHPQN